VGEREGVEEETEEVEISPREGMDFCEVTLLASEGVAFGVVAVAESVGAVEAGGATETVSLPFGFSFQLSVPSHSETAVSTFSEGVLETGRAEDEP
jgi:hypothetical protein